MVLYIYMPIIYRMSGVIYDFQRKHTTTYKMNKTYFKVIKMKLQNKITIHLH